MINDKKSPPANLPVDPIDQKNIAVAPAEPTESKEPRKSTKQPDKPDEGEGLERRLRRLEDSAIKIGAGLILLALLIIIIGGLTLKVFFDMRSLMRQRLYLMERVVVSGELSSQITDNTFELAGLLLPQGPRDTYKIIVNEDTKITLIEPDLCSLWEPMAQTKDRLIPPFWNPLHMFVLASFAPNMSTPARCKGSVDLPVVVTKRGNASDISLKNKVIVVGRPDRDLGGVIAGDIWSVQAVFGK